MLEPRQLIFKTSSKELEAYLDQMIIDMDKATILSELTKSGEITIFRRSASWEKAFKLYNEAHNTHKSPSCGSCFREVSKWLQN